MFTQLALAGVFQKISGLILGEFLDDQGKPHEVAWLKKRLLELTHGRSIPNISGLKAGHRRNEVWLPIGGVCQLEKKGRRFTLSPLVSPRVG